LSLLEVVALLALAGAGVGPMYPTTTVVIQNAVPPHQFGVATGTLAFFRQLGGAIIVAVFGAIVLGGIGADPGGLSVAKLAHAGAGGAGEHLATAFRWVFIAAAAFLSLAFIAVLAIEERPLHGPRVHAASAAAE
jgi:MFS family permease